MRKMSCYWDLGRGIVTSVVFGTILSDLAVQKASAQTDPAQLKVLEQMQDAQDQRHLAAGRAITEAQQAQQRAAANAARQQRLAAERQRQAKEASQRAVRQAEQQKADELAAAQEQYLVEKRALELEKQRLQLKIDEVTANHADEFAQANLKRYNAETNAIIAKNGSDGSSNRGDGEKDKIAPPKTHHWWKFWD